MLLPEGRINRKSFLLKLATIFDLQISKSSLFHSNTVDVKTVFEEIML